MRTRMIVSAALVLATTAAACANAPAGGSASPSTGAFSYPTRPDQVVVRIDTGGGFISPDVTLTQLPSFSLMGDGAAITPGAVPAIYPGPAMAPMFQQTYSGTAIEQILQLAKTDGLLGPSKDHTDLGSIGIADAPTTTIIVVADGQTHTFRFYALGELGGTKPPQMSQAEFDARAGALDFSKKTADTGWLPTGSVGSSQTYEPAAIRVYPKTYQADPNMTEPAVDWPLSPGLAQFGQPVSGGAGEPMRCGAVTGSDLATLLPLVQTANQLTPWTSGGKEYTLLFRPMLPDETGC